MGIPKSTQGHIFLALVILTTLWLSVWQIVSTTAGQRPDDLVINEFLAANRAGLTDEDGDYSDWIEIYNPGPQAVNLAGWSLTDDPDQPEKWALPGMTLGSHQYLLIFASGKDRKPAQPGAALHTNFKLNQAGEFLGLYHILDDRFASKPALSDENRFPEQFEDIAFGRYGQQTSNSGQSLAYGYLAIPTPGRPNEVSPLWSGLTTPVSFSPERGFYDAPFTLELATATPGATIRYTTDGSPPTETRGAIYNGPLTITTTTLIRAVALKPKFRPAPIETHSYIFLEAVLGQPQQPPGFPKTWGGYKGKPVKADYEMDPEVVNDPRYRDSLKAALTSLPTLSIVTDKQNFHDLYTNPKRRGKAWERPVSVEFIDPDNKQPGFQIEAGIRVQGELGRSESMPKHAFRLFFRREYGPPKLNYPLFPDSAIKKFETLVLRSGVNRSYAGYPKREDEIKATTYTRDEWLRASQIAVSGSGGHGRFVHLYLDGLYWGLYNLVERPDAAFMAAYFGGHEDEWQSINHAETVTNTSQRFKTLHQLAAEGRLGDPERYAAIQAYLDIPHFIDYLILNWYSGNLDWGFNNWYAGVRASTGPARYFVWDGERTWLEGAEIYMEFDEYQERPNLIKPLFEALLENPDFRVELADRMHKHLFNDGALTEAKAQARWLRLNRLIEQAIIAESARWGDTRFETPLTQADWFKARDDVLAQMEGNPARLIELARQAGYYPELDPPLFNQRGGRVGPDFEVTMSLPTGEEGIIFYTTDGSDPRLPLTGAVASTANIYHTPLPLTTTTQIKVRALAKGAWSALNEAVFSLDAANSNLQITEIMYNPIGGDDYEFIELKNSGNVDLNLANFSFEGIRFAFPANGAWLAPGELVVLVRNPQAFAQRYPAVPIGGVYGGQLSNKGEIISLKDAAGQVIVSLEYDDENGWPISADGRGDSLRLVDPTQPANDPTNWRASAQPNGSPGVDGI